MPTIGFGGRLNRGASIDQVVDQVARIQKELEYLLSGNLDTKNAREFGNWLISASGLVAKNSDVGMLSGGDDPNSIRFFAGSADPSSAPFKVLKSGALYATNANISGRITSSQIISSDIRTSETTYPRLELSSSGNLLKAMSSAYDYVSLEASYVGVPSTVYYDGGSAQAVLKYVSGSGILLTSFGSINFQATTGINLTTQTNLPTWSYLYNTSGGISLATELGQIKSRLSALEAAP